MTPADLYADFERGFDSRKFSAGLLVAFIDFLTDLDVPGKGLADFNAFLVAYPRQTTTAAGKRANTLIVARPGGGTTSLRPFYNAAERFFRAEHKRFDYPSCAPHATQAWADYLPWLNALVTFSPSALANLRTRVCNFVLTTLASQEFDPAAVTVDPPLFKMLLESFDMTSRKREPSGAVFQGLVFGFLRADNPHLQIEIDKVRTGSKRLQRVGDVDGWEGGRLAISAEVKQYILRPDDVAGLEAFANATGRRGALAVVVALGFEGDTRDQLEALGVVPLDTDEMLRIVELWDPVKQRTAVASFLYYAKHVEKNSSLGARIDAFLENAAAEWVKMRGLSA